MVLSGRATHPVTAKTRDDLPPRVFNPHLEAPETITERHVSFGCRGQRRAMRAVFTATFSSVAFSTLYISHCLTILRFLPTEVTILRFLPTEDGATGSCLFPCLAIIGESVVNLWQAADGETLFPF